MATVLLIDDSASVLELTSSFLSEGGHRVLAHRSAKTAADRLGDKELDLVITDLYMPDEDGLELIGKVRKLRPDLPVIAISGAKADLTLMRVARRLGARATLAKPFTKADLLKTVAAVLPKDSHF